MKRKGDQHSRGRGGKNFKGKGNFGGRGQSQKPQGESNQLEKSGDLGSRGGFRGRRPNGRGRFGGPGRGPNVFTGRCFNCNQVGNIMSKCPEKASISHGGERRNQLIQEEDYQSFNNLINNVDPIHGENLMKRRTLLKMPQENEPPQRKTFFRTTCLTNGKVCKVIFYFGSIEMVDKLKLKKIPHANPYKVSWLSKGQQVLVDEKAWVDFQIGEYKDRILCDVIPMDACHLLLGCPWKYDVITQHDGKNNSFLITKNGV